ncbi:hypothetical protein FA13DRAFT_1733008 [Coprinellus micaceus]|uniref:Uncharacterized protein n=1 Tax=Coprinellus micaceus TaxID=71717 RepID=A0A4Y7TBV3_COPMI|nr:hypothetical protein FA13DRAFT_1733008 [Coprinellus micaceus]
MDQLQKDLAEKAQVSDEERRVDEGLEKQREGFLQKAEILKAKSKEAIDDKRPARPPFVALWHSGTKPGVGPDATPEEKQEGRHRRLRALNTKHRKVFSTSPRDPHGRVIGPDETAGTGKQAPLNGIEAWGDSIFDFHRVASVPAVEDYILYSTGGRRLAWTKKHGETFVEDQLAMRERELGPQEVHPWPVAEAFKDIDRRVKMFQPFKDQGRNPLDEIEFGLREPFAPIAAAPLLQERVPFRLLPKKLVVHDPSRLLRASYRNLAEEPKDWDAKPDLVSVYRLELSEEGKKKLKEEDNMLEKLRKEGNKALANFLESPTSENMPPDQGILFHTGEQEELGPSTPALFFVHGPTPIKQPIEEAHVYLSPHHLVGKGNHSYAFKVDWEVPRSMVVPDHLCDICVIEKGLTIVLKEDGPKGERKNPQWNQRLGEVVEGVVSTAIDCCGKEVLYKIQPRRLRTKKQYHGPLRVIHTGVEYQNPEDGPLCKHLVEGEQPPSLTASVSVVAKLSHPYDYHLPHEAKSYQAFPTHFFQHFTGSNQLRPLRDPFPIGAVVPQFYGYYVPEADNKPMIFDKKVPGSGVPGDVGEATWKATKLKYDYRSPIMLLEYCGRAIPDDVRELSIDDRRTCASLFLRMHNGGWVQGSPYTRNVLMQSGPIDTSPLSRIVNGMNERSDLRQTMFRLIDFGRSEEFGWKTGDRIEEEGKVMELFELPHHT